MASASSRLCHSWRPLVAAAAVAVAALAARRALVSLARRRELNGRRRRQRETQIRQKRQFGKYLEECGMSNDEMEAIVGLGGMELLRRLRRKELNPDRVLLAYQLKAYEVDKRCNCVIEFLRPDLSQVNLEGPMAGMPVSVKDNAAMRGRSSCVGLSCLADSEMPSDSVCVSCLTAIGCVPFVRTVVPQTMMTVLSTNPIDGSVCNPLDDSRSPGGSSSGEAALVSAGGSPLGVGTDIGGSIRLPAAWCGVSGFKPTSGRLSLLGYRSITPQRLVPSSWGPIASECPLLTEFIRSLCQCRRQFQLDPSVPPLPFVEPGGGDVGDGGVSSGMRIGWYDCSADFCAVPSVKRAVAVAVEALKARGHSLVRWQPPDSLSVMKTYLRAVNCDRALMLNRMLTGDIKTDSVQLGLHAYGNRLSLLLRQLYCQLTGDADSAVLLAASRGFSSVHAMWLFNQEVQQFKSEMMNSWREAGLDAVICPCVGCPAIDLHPRLPFIGTLSYLLLYNLANMPAGSVPVTRVTESDLEAMTAYPREKSMWHRSVADMQTGTLGLPVSVQCVTLPWRDEKCLRLMEEVEAACSPR